MNLGIGIGVCYGAAGPAPLTVLIDGLKALPSPGLILCADVGVTPGATFTWADQSGNGFNCSQATAGKQPAVTASGLGTRAVLTFDGGDVLNGSTAITSTTPWTAYVVHKFNSTSALCYSFKVGDAGGGWGMSMHGNGTQKRTFALDAIAFEDGSVGTTNAELWEFSNPSGVGPQELYFNGASDGPTPSNNTEAAPAAEYHVGGRNSTPNFGLAGYVAFVAVYGATHSAGERTTARGLINTYYGIY